ncbi:TPA: hypothetical protein DCL22_00445 [Candidatus Moranbacteria bacterium]|nr:hypothetical protein [Candidatus Moranbacteria bacterium]
MNCKELLEKIEQELKLRNYSRKTIKSYLYYITDLLTYANKNPTTSELMINT